MSITQAEDLLRLYPAGYRLWVAQQKLMQETRRSFHTSRDLFTDKNMWAPQQNQLFFQMYQLGLFNLKVLSVGCGAAHNEKVLDQLIRKTKSAGSVRCTDMKVCPDACLPVEVLPACAAIQKYPSEVLYLSWPTYNHSWAQEALVEFKGDWLVYVGEEPGGCCADESFFEVLEKEWTEKPFCDEQHNWWGLHCSAHIYQRRT